MITKFNLYEKITPREELNKDALPDYNDIEPALMTQKEYLNHLEAFKSHPDDAYQFSLKEDNKKVSSEYLNTNFNILNTIKHGSEYIKYYVDNGEKNKDASYIKTDDDGEVVRDKDGMAVSMTEEEIVKSGYRNKYDRNVIAVNNNQQIVGSAQNEWGCVLIYVVEEYKGVGVGKELANFYRKYYPSRTSGGTTSGGFKNLIKYHERQVRLYLRNGIYSDMVKNNELTNKRAKEIINSIDKTPYSKHTKDNEYTKFSQIKTYNKAILYEGNDIMLINDALLDFYDLYDKTENNIDDISENFIFAHARIHEDSSLGDEFLRLYFIDGDSEKEIYDIIKYALSLMEMKFKEKSFRYYITENTDEVTKKAILNLKNNKEFNIKEVPNDVNRYIISANNLDTKKYNKDLYNGTKWFYSLKDKYDELKNKIVEEVYRKYQ